MKLRIAPKYNWNRIFRLLYATVYDKEWLDDLYGFILSVEHYKPLELNEITELECISPVSFSTEAPVIVPTGLQLKSGDIMIESLIPDCKIERYSLPGFEEDLILLVTSKSKDTVHCINELEKIARIREVG